MPEARAKLAAPSDPLLILIPVFNDWAALQKLLVSLDGVLSEHRLEANVLIIDDGSTVSPAKEFPGQGFAALEWVDILKLRRNMGHQRAIAIGLAYIENRLSCRAVVIMDSDGEDDPRDVPRLLKAYEDEAGQKIIFAERTERSETWHFRACYSLYKGLHYLLTGQSVRVGNFSVVPAERLASLVVTSEIWNHYAAAMFKSRQPIGTLPTKRGQRLEGPPKMSFVSLVIHGLSAISVYGDIVGARLLGMAFALILLAVVGISGTVAVRLMTDLAIPGWATYATGVLLIILFQAIMFSMMLSFIILANRQGSTFLPLRDYAYFVGVVKRCWRNDSELYLPRRRA